MRVTHGSRASPGPANKQLVHARRSAAPNACRPPRSSGKSGIRRAGLRGHRLSVTIKTCAMTAVEEVEKVVDFTTNGDWIHSRSSLSEMLSPAPRSGAGSLRYAARVPYRGVPPPNDRVSSRCRPLMHPHRCQVPSGPRKDDDQRTPGGS